jgi:hypothetical protein
MPVRAWPQRALARFDGGLHLRNAPKRLGEKIGHLTHPLAGTRYAHPKSHSLTPGGIFVDDEKQCPPSPRASIRLWLAVLLSVIALWFVDGLLKPGSRRPNSERK